MTNKIQISNLEYWDCRPAPLVAGVKLKKADLDKYIGEGDTVLVFVAEKNIIITKLAKDISIDEQKAKIISEININEEDFNMSIMTVNDTSKNELYLRWRWLLENAKTNKDHIYIMMTQNKEKMNGYDKAASPYMLIRAYEAKQIVEKCL